MDWFTMSYTVLGGLGIFFFGMKLFSEALQAISSTFIRRAISTVTTNRVLAVLIGILVTLLVQSSSITTVMTVGFVNAGLMTLKQAIGVIFGANIGTTITGWIIAIKINQYSLLLIGMAVFPLFLARNDMVAAWAKVVLALGFVFLGLQFMSDAFRPLRDDQGFLEFITLFSADNYPSLLATIGLGCLVTLVVQSSSATLGITIALASTGAISFQTAVALVLGENIGTTITAVLAATTGNSSARRAALAHTVFNVAGVFIVSLVFWNYTSFVDSIISGSPDTINEMGDKPYIAAHIAAAHTVFNVMNVILFLPLLGTLARFVQFVIPERETKEAKHLEFLGPASTVSAPLAIAQARKEIEKFIGMVGNMIEWSYQYLLLSQGNEKLRRRILKYEAITDNIHQEMMHFCGITMLSNLTSREVADIKSHLMISDELESLADYCQKLTSHKVRLLQRQIEFDQETKHELIQLMKHTEQFYAQIQALILKDSPISIEYLRTQREEFNKLANHCRDSYLDRIANNNLPPMTSLTISDIVLDISRVFSHTRNIAESYMGIQSSLAD